MKTIFFIVTFILLLFWILQASKTFETVYYTERVSGVVPVQKNRFEWHPERLMPFVKKYPENIQRSLKKGLDHLRQRGASSQNQTAVAPSKDFVTIRLKNGTEIMGRIVEEKGGVVWVEIEGGKIAFKKDEVVTTAP